jgi:hypothetical protein
MSRLSGSKVAMRGWYCVAATGLAMVASSGGAAAQTQPAPGPTNPPPVTSSAEKPGAEPVIDPTDEECRAGWTPTAKWTKQEFEDRCARLLRGK